MKDLDGRLSADTKGLTKKEILTLTRQRDKLEQSLGGIRDMGGVPDVMVVIDTNKETIAIQEANNLNIPVVAILDTNCSPDGIAFPIPGNDDASRAIKLYADAFADAILDGLQEEMVQRGVDTGAMDEPAVEDVPAEAPAKDASAEEASAEA